MSYYSVSVLGEDINKARVRGVHIIKARSEQDALRIRKQHGISNPLGAVENKNDKFYIKISKISYRYQTRAQR